MSAQAAALYRNTNSVCLFCKCNDIKTHPWPLLETWLQLNVPPPAVFEGCSRKLFDLEDTYWNSFCAARYFPWNIISQKARCMWRALWGSVWHSGINESLCCFVGLTSSLDSSSRTDCSRVWWETPRVTLDHTLSSPDFISHTDAAVSSIPTRYCSSFCKASQLKFHLPVPHRSLSLSWVSLAGGSMTSVPLHGSTAAPAVALFQPACLSSAFPAVTHCC